MERLNEPAQIIQEVDTIYHWLDEQISGLKQPCDACGDCCDFESFGHKLYVSTPELIYFQHHLGSNIKEMITGICPYRIKGKCTVYPYRFSGCRIFCCKGEDEKQNKLSEKIVRKFKILCDEYGTPYHYVYLKSGLEMMSRGPEFKIMN
ncbi:MAG: YkgJ family cysteine cluster protein [Planctomycetota bacterium]